MNINQNILKRENQIKKQSLNRMQSQLKEYFFSKKFLLLILYNSIHFYYLRDVGFIASMGLVFIDIFLNTFIIVMDRFKYNEELINEYRERIHLNETVNIYKDADFKGLSVGILVLYYWFTGLFCLIFGITMPLKDAFNYLVFLLYYIYIDYFWNDNFNNVFNGIEKKPSTKKSFNQKIIRYLHNLKIISKNFLEVYNMDNIKINKPCKYFSMAVILLIILHYLYNNINDLFLIPNVIIDSGFFRINP